MFDLDDAGPPARLPARRLTRPLETRAGPRLRLLVVARAVLQVERDAQRLAPLRRAHFERVAVLGSEVGLQRGAEHGKQARRRGNCVEIGWVRGMVPFT